MPTLLMLMPLTAEIISVDYDDDDADIIDTSIIDA